MTDTDVREAIALLGRMLALIETVSGGRGRPAADLRRAIGELQARAEILIRGAVLGRPLGELFPLATRAGVRPQDWRRVVEASNGESADGLPAQAIALAVERLAIGELVRAMQGVTLRSRDEAQAWVARLNPVFAAATDRAADLRSADMFRALKALHAAAVRDLTERGRPLARIVRRTFPARLPSLVIAHRVYQDAGRHGELVGENEAIHPAFMPDAIKALSQ